MTVVWAFVSTAEKRDSWWGIPVLVLGILSAVWFYGAYQEWNPSTMEFEIHQIENIQYIKHKDDMVNITKECGFIVMEDTIRLDVWGPWSQGVLMMPAGKYVYEVKEEE